MDARGVTAGFLIMVAAGVVGDWSVRGADSVAVTAGRHARVATFSSPTTVPATRWAPYGVTDAAEDSTSTVVIEPDGRLLTDQWFGATSKGPSICDFRVDFDARLVGPQHVEDAAALGYGYAFAPRGKVKNDVPAGDSLQYDPPFGGLRTVELPSEANDPGHNVHVPQDVQAGRLSHWTVVVEGATAAVQVDGGPSVQMDVGADCGGDLLFRVWNAKLEVSNVVIKKLHRF